MTWTAGRVWGTHEIATAAKMNEISGDLDIIGNAWTTYSPTVTASTTDPTMGASIIVGSYRLMGKTADVKVGLTIGAGWASGSGFYRFDLPAGITPISSGAGDPHGVCTVWDVSAGVAYNGTVITSTGTTVRLFINAAAVGSAGPVVFATGDRINVKISSMEIT